jgi:aryl-alcohol dehydrogenase-like predicted oxidoreductase
MEQRTLGSTGREVSVIGLGTWQLGADWGSVSEADALAVLESSVEAGVTFFDTADVYGDGRSEQVIGRFLASHPEITVATKMGRRMDQVPENYTPDNFRAWTDRSRRNLGVDTLDLVQLHCPPSAVIDADATYDALDTLVDEGAIAAYGVSVETSAQALSAVVGEVRRDDDVRRRRPPHLQPPRRGVRRRRDVLGRRLCDRCQGGEGVHGAGAVEWGRRDAGPGRPRVDRAAAGRHDGDPGCAKRRTSARERCCWRHAAVAG